MNRRLMMAQQQEIDLLEGYRVNNTNVYSINSEWLDKKSVRLYSSGFHMGAQEASANFIGIEGQQNTQLVHALTDIVMTTLKKGSTYKLTLTVKEVLKNGATAEKDATFTLGLGKRQFIGDRDAKKLSEVTIGTKFETSQIFQNNISGAAIHISDTVAYDFICEVAFKEV